MFYLGFSCEVAPRKPQTFLERVIQFQANSLESSNISMRALDHAPPHACFLLCSLQVKLLDSVELTLYLINSAHTLQIL